MCSTYEGRQTHQDIDRMVRSNFKDVSYRENRFFYNVGDLAPVLQFGPKGYSVSEMYFKLVPNWSDTKDIKFSTHNARLVGTDKSGSDRPVYAAPSFRSAYKNGRVLVPMSSFIEPSYWGELEGNMVTFARKSKEPLFCAAIHDEWADKKSGEVYSGYSLLVHTPYDVVLEGGHHRSPFFISPDVFQEWAHIGDSQLSFDFLLANREAPALVPSIQRPMVDGWQKRKAMHIKKAHDEGLDLSRFA